MKTAAELAAEAGVTRRTIDRWVRKGYLPEPMFRPSPLGHGALAQWEDWVVDCCVRMRDGDGPPVARLLARISATHLDDALELLEANASESAKKLETDLSEAEREELETLVREGIAVRLSQLLATEMPPRRLMTHVRRRSVVADALDLHRKGMNPVLVLDGSQAYVAADFLVAERLRVDGAMSPTAVIAIPLFNLICSAFEAVERPRLADPIVKAIREVELRAGGAKRRVRYRPVGIRGADFDAKRPVRRGKDLE